MTLPITLRRRTRLVSTALLATSALVALAACGDSSSGSGGSSGSGSKAPIVIGHAAGQTGFMVAYDGDVKKFAQIAMDDINAKGGVDGHKLELITTDTKSQPELGQAAADEAIDKGAQIIIPSCDYDMGGGAAREAMAKGLLAIGCAGSTNYGVTGMGPLVFNTYASNAAESATMGQFAFDKKYTKPAYLVDSSLAVMPEQCKFAKQTYEHLGGGSSVADETFKNADASVATQVDKIKSAHPDVVFLCSYLPGGGSAAKQLRAAMPDVPIISGVGMEGTSWTQSVPNLSNYYAVSLGAYAGPDPNAQREAAFAAYQKKYGKRPSLTLGMTGYTDIQLIAKALEITHGDTDGTKLAKALETLKGFPALTGSVTYSSTCHIPFDGSFVVMQMKQGKPSLAAEVKPSYVPKAPC